MWCLKILASHRRSFFFEGSCRPPQVEQVGVWQRARFSRLCGMMKAQEIQFDGVRMYMWCLKILASHRRGFFFEGSCRSPHVKQVGVWQRARFGRLCGMMKDQEIQFDGVRMYMWCLKILASHRRSFYFEGLCRPPQVEQVGVSHRRSFFFVSSTPG